MGPQFLDESGGSCYCGKRVVWKQSLPALHWNGFMPKSAAVKKKLKDIVTEYRQGNAPFAQQTMERLFEQFGRAVAVVINIVDPDVIVIGGGVGNIDEIIPKGREGQNTFSTQRVKWSFSNPVWEIVPVSLVRLCCDDCAHNSIKQTLNHSIIVVFKDSAVSLHHHFQLYVTNQRSHIPISGETFCFSRFECRCQRKPAVAGKIRHRKNYFITPLGGLMHPSKGSI